MENYKTYILQNLDFIDNFINQEVNINNCIWYYDNNTLFDEFFNCIYDGWLNNYKYIIISNIIDNNLLESIIKENNDLDIIIYTINDVVETNINIYNNDIVVLNERGMKILLDYHFNKHIYDIAYKYNKLYDYNINNTNLINIVNINDINNNIILNDVIKIGSFGFFDQMINTNQKYKKSDFVQKIFINTLIENNINCKYVNPFEEKCDICFYSLFNYNFNVNINKPSKMEYCKYIMKDIIGYPIFIYYTPENESVAWTQFHNNYDLNSGNNYSISFYKTTERNLYFPLWVQRLYEYDWFYDRQTNIKLNQKTKFCTYIVSNEDNNTKRDKIFQYIFDNYKHIDSIGKHLNNQEDNFILPKEDYKETNLNNINYHHKYKFNLCCENSESFGDLDYITEKIINAFLYKVVPIYLGSSNIEKYFNKDAFININDLSFEEIIDKIKEIDEDDEKYYNMLNAYPFNEIKNYKEFYKHNIYEFLLQILKDNKYVIEQYNIK